MKNDVNKTVLVAIDFHYMDRNAEAFLKISSVIMFHSSKKRHVGLEQNDGE